jgi:hypothetical protein
LILLGGAAMVQYLKGSALPRRSHQAQLFTSLLKQVFQQQRTAMMLDLP